MIGQPRAPGRHRAGQPLAPAPVYRRVWDGPARDQAEALERSRPGWVVLYGAGSRRFFAMAAWPAPEPVMVEAATADDLQKRMSEAEIALLQAATSTAVPGRPRRLRPPATPPLRHPAPCRTARRRPSLSPEGGAA